MRVIHSLKNDFRKTPLFYLVVAPLFASVIALSVWEFGWEALVGWGILFVLIFIGDALVEFG